MKDKSIAWCIWFLLFWVLFMITLITGSFGLAFYLKGMRNWGVVGMQVCGLIGLFTCGWWVIKNPDWSKR